MIWPNRMPFVLYYAEITGKMPRRQATSIDAA